MASRPQAVLLTWRHRLVQRALRLLGPAAQHSPREYLPPPRRLLIAKVSGLGDGVLARGVAEHLRQLRPALEIGVLVCPPTLEVLSDASNFTVHCYNPRREGIPQLIRLLRGIRRARYDVALDLEQYTVLTPLFLRLAGVPIRVGFSNLAEPARARFLTDPFPIDRARSVWQNYVALAARVEPALASEVLPGPLPLSEEAQSWTNGWIATHFRDQKGPLICFHVGGSPRVTYKNWPIERFVALGEKLRSAILEMRLVLSGTPSDRPLIDDFMRGFKGRAVDASKFGTLQRTAALLSSCDLLVSNDTGTMHLGAAMGTPTVGLFGATHPAHWAPVGKRATYVRQTTVPCSPCSIAVDNLTPLACSHREVGRCMRDITVEAVIEAAKAVASGGWLTL